MTASARPPDEPTMRELLARLDERTERLDRDIRQVILGQNARAEALEARMEEVTRDFRNDYRTLEAMVSRNNKIAEKAAEMSSKHDEWLTWSVRILVGAVMLAMLAVIGVAS